MHWCRARALLSTATPGTSALIRCLQQLDDDVWAEVLLPKLVKDKSAAAVAASCSTLRKLCHGSVRKLNLIAVGCSSAMTGRRQFAALHQHFPDCTTVKVALSGDSSYLIAPAILEGLSR